MTDPAFALCLTHDVDRPSKGLAQTVYYALDERPLYHGKTLLTREDPYWQLDSLMELERELGVRSAFYFLQEPSIESVPPAEWTPTRLVEQLGRYDPDELREVIARLDEGGWEVGIHGSLRAALDRERFETELDRLETILGREVAGGRQHHLQLRVPGTWHDHARAGLAYDASLGSGETYGFEYGPHPVAPLSEGPLVFPLTLMEQALPDPGRRFPAAWAACERLLEEAAKQQAVMTVLFHQRHFNEREFPGYRRLYRELIERAREMGAWIGPPGALCHKLGLEVPPSAPAEPQ